MWENCSGLIKPKKFGLGTKLRIQNNRPLGGVRDTKVKSGPSRSTGSFQVSSDDQTEAASTNVSVGNVANLGALLSLQDVEDATTGKRRTAKRGFDILDRLDEMRIGLLGGRLSSAQVNQIAHKIKNLGRTGDKQLDSILEDIDMRARVELAKIGVYDI